MDKAYETSQHEDSRAKTLHEAKNPNVSRDITSREVDASRSLVKEPVNVEELDQFALRPTGVSASWLADSKQIGSARDSSCSKTSNAATKPCKLTKPEAPGDAKAREACAGHSRSLLNPETLDSNRVASASKGDSANWPIARSTLESTPNPSTDRNTVSKENLYLSKERVWNSEKFKFQ